MRSVALANQKGGVGKTTTAIHLAHGLAIAGAKVALLDMDPQGNASVAIQGLSASGKLDLPGALWPDATLRQVDGNLWQLNAPGLPVPSRAKLHPFLEKHNFQWLIVDCPPRLDEWGWAGIRLCEEVLVPVQAEFFSIHGLSMMLSTLASGQQADAGSCQLLGVLPTMVEWRDQLCREILEDLRTHLGGKLLESMILRDSAVVEAASHGETVFSYMPTSSAALTYGELVMEIING